MSEASDDAVRASRNAIARNHPAWCGVTAMVLLTSSCAKVIGADFSDLLPYEPEAGGDAGPGEESREAGPVDRDASVDASLDAPTETLRDATVSSDAPDLGNDVASNGGPSLDAAHEGGQPDADVLDGVDAMDAERVSVDSAPDVSLADALADAHGDDAPDERASGRVVINELNATGALEDFIELYNAGEGPAVLDGFSVAQAQQAYGSPNLASRLIFAAGTVLAPGERLLIVANQPADGGPFAPCPAPLFAASSCYTVKWGISRQGERIYLLAPAVTSVADDGDYPDTPSPVSDRSWGRVPDGTGPFQWIPYSPGAPNSAM